MQQVGVSIEGSDSLNFAHHWSHPPQTCGSQRLPADLYGSESGDGFCLCDLCEDLILHKHGDSEVTCRPVWGWERWRPPSPWSLWGSHPPRTRGSQRLSVVLYGSESSDSLRLCDLCEDLILREHGDLRGYLSSCMGVRAVTASVSVISVRISSFANTWISEVTCRPVWEWERWRPPNPRSLWGSHPPLTRGYGSKAVNREDKRSRR